MPRLPKSKKIRSCPAELPSLWPFSCRISTVSAFLGQVLPGRKFFFHILDDSGFLLRDQKKSRPARQDLARNLFADPARSTIIWNNKMLSVVPENFRYWFSMSY